MEILIAITVMSVFLVLYVNVKVTLDIASSADSSENEMIFSYFFVWLIPLLGVLFVPKKVLPNLHSKPDDTSLFSGDGGGSGGDCG